MNLLKWVRDRLGLSPAAAGRSHHQGPIPTASSYGFEAQPDGGEDYIRLEGEIDYLSAGEVQKRMLEVLDLVPGAVHFDLRGISFMDHPALNVLAKVVKRLCSERRPVSCVTNQRMGRIFGMCGLAPLLNVTVED